MNLEPVVLARLQFGATASFHILFPCLIIGLATYLAALKILWMKTDRTIYRAQFEFWVKPFAAVFVIGVVTGVVLSWQLDTVFSGFYEQTVDVLVPIRKIEFANAMWLEAGCFCIMVWGRNRVGERLHLLATLAVTVGIYVSVFCILARNSWMQTPDGFVLVDGRLRLEDWRAAVFNPSLPYRFVHMVGAAWISTGFVVAGVNAWILLKDDRHALARQGLRTALLASMVLVPLQVISGDLHGLNTRDHQPVKLAAMEGLWHTRAGAPLVPFAIPDPGGERNRYALEIPKLASLIITHDPDGVVEGLSEVPKAERPNVPIVFYSFRIMVGLGLLMLAVAALGGYLMWTRRLFGERRFLRLCCCVAPSGLLATIAGWCVTEAGRQPWVVYGLIRTGEITRANPVEQTLGTVALIGAAYVALLVWLMFFLRRIAGLALQDPIGNAGGSTAARGVRPSRLRDLFTTAPRSAAPSRRRPWPGKEDPSSGVFPARSGDAHARARRHWRAM